jgi:pimeloyl-ACP methyl ester carboxylesterase
VVTVASLWRAAPALAALILATTSCGGSAAPPVVPGANSLSLKPCTVSSFAARCGTLTVPEDRLTGKGRTIPVRVVVIPAAGRDRAPDPVVYFAGGPGGSTVDLIPSEMPDLVNLNAQRDIVFIEQRGTGKANPLTCPAFTAALADKAALRASVTSCLAHLNGDLRFYTTAMYTDDVAQVLTDLHYVKANLMGISYGVSVEQVFALRHPGMVRTMTFQSGTPLSVPVFERQPASTQAALDYVFARCDSQPACHRAFPHLAADWTALWSSLGKAPWTVPAAQSPAKKAMRMDQGDVQSAIYQLLYTGNEAPIPVVVHTLGAARNKTAAMIAVASAAARAGLTPAAGGSAEPMLLYETECAEPWASERPAALTGRDSFAYQADYEGAAWFAYVCSLIPRSAAAVGSEQLTVSAVPVLAFNGAGDPIDPPANMAGARAIWPDSLDITLPGQGHDVNSFSWEQCAGTLTATFIAQASVAGLNANCLASVSALLPAFDLSLQDLALGAA